MILVKKISVFHCSMMQDEEEIEDEMARFFETQCRL